MNFIIHCLFLQKCGMCFLFPQIFLSVFAEILTIYFGVFAEILKMFRIISLRRICNPTQSDIGICHAKTKILYIKIIHQFPSHYKCFYSRGWIVNPVERGSNYLKMQIIFILKRHCG